MSPNIERLALDAVASDDDDIGLDTLRAVSTDLLMLYGALTNDARPNTEDVAQFVAQIRHRIDLALALAEAERGAS